MCLGTFIFLCIATDISLRSKDIDIRHTGACTPLMKSQKMRCNRYTETYMHKVVYSSIGMTYIVVNGGIHGRRLGAEFVRECPLISVRR